jgi:hypothetical protein
VITPRKRTIWPLIGLGTASAVVLLFLGSFVWRLLNPPVSPYVESDTTHQVIQMDVVNASGTNGAGRQTMMFLRERGFDVVELSTARQLETHSFVIDRVGDRQSALKVADVLGIADSLVRSDIDSMLFVRASVVLGKDLVTLQPFKGS